MGIRKNSVIIVVVPLLVIAVILVTVSLQKNDTVDPSSLSVPRQVSIVQWFSPNPRYGGEFEYRIKGVSLPYVNQGVIATVDRSSFKGSRALKEYALSSGNGIRKFSASKSKKSGDKRYGNYLGIVGYCSKKRRSGFEPFYQVRKYIRLLKRYEYAYAVGLKAVNALIDAGFSRRRVVCYVRNDPSRNGRSIPSYTLSPTPKPTPKPTKNPTVTPVPNQIPIVQWFKPNSETGGEYEYRKKGESIPGFQNEGVIATLDQTGGSYGSRALEEYALSSNRRIRKFAFSSRGQSGDRDYSDRIGTVGYCWNRKDPSRVVPVYRPQPTRRPTPRPTRKPIYTRDLIPKQVSIVQWFEPNRRTGGYWEYRKEGVNVAGFINQGVIATLDEASFEGSRALKEYALSSNNEVRKFSFSDNGRSGDHMYSKLIGEVGYCSIRRPVDFEPLYELQKYVKELRGAYEYAYAAGKKAVDALVKAGFSNRRLLCFIRLDPAREKRDVLAYTMRPTPKPTRKPAQKPSGLSDS